MHCIGSCKIASNCESQRVTICSPLNSETALHVAPHSRRALVAMMSNTGCTWVGDFEMTPRISPVAV